MMSQGIAFDAFLRQHFHDYKDYIRISVHHHHPKKGKFAVDLFKQVMYRVLIYVIYVIAVIRGQ